MRDRTVAFYHWWGSGADAPPYANLRAPVLVSVATLRAVNPDIPIVVLDLTTEAANDWRHFPAKLGFDVYRVAGCMARHKGRVPGHRHLSRIGDVRRAARNRHNCKTALYVDSDVFFFRDPLPLAADPSKFCFNGWNSGLFYHAFPPDEPGPFLEAFDAYVGAAVLSEDIRRVLRQYVGYDAWYGVWDEMVLTYMTRHHPDLFAPIPAEEHATARTLAATDPSKVKAFHANGTMVANEFPKVAGEKDHCRGLLGLVVREFHDNLRKVLSEADLKLVYTDIERRHYLPRQFSLLESPARLTAARAADGHYHLSRLLAPPYPLL